MSSKRTIKTFEPDEDIARMLARAEKEGLRLKHILNQSCRAWLTKEGYARKKDLTFTPAK